MSKTSLVLFLVLGFFGIVWGAILDEVGPASPRDQVAAVLRRHQQLPLNESEALVAASLARDVGDSEAEIELLVRACEGGDLAAVARVELAEALVESEPGRALDLVLPVVERPQTSQLRSAGVDVLVQAIGSPIDAQQRLDVERLAARLPKTLRRKIQVVLGEAATPEGRRRLVALIRENPGDGPALMAARKLESLTDLGDSEEWQVARSLYRHALYDEAVPRLDRLLGGTLKLIPGWEVALLRGRCSFRMDDWNTAILWYQRALTMTTRQSTRAELEVHLARTLELVGRLDEAVEAARRAVLADTTDSRRLFLARLRLRTGRVDLAEAGISRVRRSTNRSRGRLLVALDSLAKGNSEKALTDLQRVSRRPWRGPARVLEAGLLVRLGRPGDAIHRLEGVAGGLESYWVNQAKRVMGSLPAETLHRWRIERSQAVAAGGTKSSRALVRLAVLEPDPARYPEIRRMVADLRPLTGPDPQPRGIADQLWALGLRREAVRWNPGGFPGKTARGKLWSASAFLRAGNPARAIRSADAGWRSRGADIPPAFYSTEMVAALFPLPDPEALTRAAAAGGIHASLVAGVAREESRWDPSVRSRVGARGLMQLMPATAATVAARLGRRTPTPEDLFDPSLSLTLGASELGRLHAAFGGFSAAAVAAYNAGEAQSRLWREQCGMDCDEARFVLTVSFDATRGYTADVLAAAAVYESMIRERIGEPGNAHDNAKPNGRSQR